MSTDYLELIKQVVQHLETIIEKMDSLVFWPITWDDSYLLLRELETAVEQIDKLNGLLETIFDDESFCDDIQNKAIVQNLDEAYSCFDSFSSHFSNIESVLREEGPRENYEEDYDYLSAQLKKAKQYLNQILM
jgi:hypothetical protein